MIDSHCHLADEAFAGDLDDVAGRARAAGVTEALCILSADEPDEVARAAIVSRAWPAVRYATAVHPHRAGGYAGRVTDAIAATHQAARASHAAALGEMGLDYHYDFAPPDVQREVFDAQAGLAVELTLPVVIHTREAAKDTFDILRRHGVGTITGVMHCFTGTLEEAKQSLELGFYVSISGIATFPRSSELRDIAKFIPDDRLLVETDAPFLAPIPHRGKRNEPAWVVETLRRIAETRGVDAIALGAQVTANFHALFGRPSDESTA
ncbi:MAG TPA: TatD family hydrolase [Vicinamibacterales bacterium]|nr:TatD family hydrolase [Vicinamibacterales bacterium]